MPGSASSVIHKKMPAQQGYERLKRSIPEDANYAFRWLLRESRQDGLLTVDFLYKGLDIKGDEAPYLAHSFRCAMQSTVQGIVWHIGLLQDSQVVEMKSSVGYLSVKNSQAQLQETLNCLFNILVGKSHDYFRYTADGRCSPLQNSFFSFTATNIVHPFKQECSSAYVNIHMPEEQPKPKVLIYSERTGTGFIDLDKAAKAIEEGQAAVKLQGRLT